MFIKKPALLVFIVASTLLLPRASTLAASGDSLVVGIPRDMPPLAFMSAEGGVRGLSVDLASFLGASLKKKIQLRQGSMAELQSLLASGSIDLACGVADPPTHGFLSLISPFAINRHILVASDSTHITCEKDFLYQHLAILRGDPYALTARQAGAVVTFVDNYHQGLDLLIEGQVNAFVPRSGEIASYLAQRKGLSQVRIMGLSLERIPIVVLVNPKITGDLSAHISDALMNLEQRGKLEILREKWLGRPLTATNFFEEYKIIILYTFAGGLALFILVMVWVVTLRRQVVRVTRRLKNSERRYRELIEASPDMVLLLSPNGHIQLANRTARETLGINPQDPEASSALLHAMCGQGRTCLGRLLDQAQAGDLAREEVTIHPDTEKTRYIEFIAAPTLAPKTDASEGGDLLVCCIGRDTTARRHLEHELMQVERQAVLGKLAASVAHEINNPLGIIMTNTDMALEETESTPIRRYLEAIQRNVDRAAATTRRLLNVAMPQELNNAQQNLSDIIQESLSFLHPKLQKISVDLSGLESPLLLNGDRIQLEQLCINLFLNALDSMGGEGHLTVRGYSKEGQDGPLVCAEIQDTGKGIEPGNLERIFDIFFTTQKSHGFGLGLFISRRIAERHGGRLYAESEPGRGASMILEFPAVSCLLQESA